MENRPMESKPTHSGMSLYSLLRSAAAIIGGAFVVVALSLGCDQMMHVMNVFPPPGEPIKDHGLLFLAFFYRSVYGIAGGYITAWLAPHSPMRHVWIGGGIGFMASMAGVIAAINMNLGPFWYPVALLVTALPCAWAGGRLHHLRLIQRAK
jgi:hypothetical protein